MQFYLLTSEQLSDFLNIYQKQAATDQLIPAVTALYEQIYSQQKAEGLFPTYIIDLSWATYLSSVNDTLASFLKQWNPNSILEMKPLEIEQLVLMFNLKITDKNRLFHIFRLAQILINNIVPNNLIKVIFLNKLKTSFEIPTEISTKIEDDPYYINYRKINLIDDGSKFAFGTKQRITNQYVKLKVSQNYKEFIYAGPSTAMGAYALAMGCVENSVKCTLFLVGPEIPAQGKIFLNKIQYADLVTINLLHMSLEQCFENAEKYVSSDPRRLLVPFGINDPIYKNMLTESLKIDPDLATLWQHPPRRMWLAVGSGVLLSILLQLLPSTIFLVVQVGKKLNINELNPELNKTVEYSNRIVIYSAPESFTQPANIMPPYSSLNNYDAKVWQFVISEGQSSDAIWNVAKNY